MPKKTLREALLASTVIAGMTCFATPAFAQASDAQGATTPPPGASGVPAPSSDRTPAAGVQTQESAGPAEQTSEGEIVVTGTLIKNPSLTSSSPVTAVGQEEIQLRQTNSAEEILRTIPGAVPSIGAQVNNGNGGASFVDLRGLGSNRNIVLLDGARIVPSGLVGRVDLNNIPLALIDRVDVLTGGASSTYGADAISGVVNFITRSDFSGVEINGSSGITERGDGRQLRADVTIGGNFGDGRGNAVLSLGYINTRPVYQGDRPFSLTSLESYQFENTAGAGSSTTTPSALDIGGGQKRQQVSADGTNIVPFYQSFNFNPYNIFQTPFKRFNMYSAGHYEVADGLEVYARGMYSNNTVRTIVAPSGVFASSVTVPVSNPFLSAGERTRLCAIADTDPNTSGNQTLTTAQCAAAAAATNPSDPNYRAFTFGLRRRTVEAGPRISNFNTQIFDFRTGLRGRINSHLNFDIFGSYGQSENTQTLQGYVLTSRVRQALLATNTSTCITNTNGCVPLNIFGPAGSITPAMVGFITGESTTRVQTSLSQVRGLINGDFGFTSPFAVHPVTFATGVEYRKYYAQQRSDSLAQQAGELGGAGGAAPNITGGYDVVEGLAEVIVPLVESRPLFETLQLEAGVRQSHYKIFAPGDPKYNTTTWKVGGQWRPVSDVKFRGNYQRSVRAPNISELFSPISTGLTNLATDPCAGTAPLNNANLKAICLAQGAPAGVIGTIQNPTAAQANVTGGGNPNLKPEIARSWTVGAVFQPSFVPHFSVTLDYYNIRVKGAITTPTPGDLIAACFGATPTSPPANAGNAACTIIRRSPGTGGLDGDPATTPGLFGALSNLGKIYTDGFDLGLNYRTPLPFAGAKLNISFNGNYTRHSQFQATPTSVNRECTGYYSVNCASLQPKYSFTERTTLTFGQVDVSLAWRYIGKMRFEPSQFASDLAAAQADPVGCPSPLGADAGGCVVDPQTRQIGARHYFDFATRFNVSERMEMTLTVTNLFNKQPPIVGQTIGSTTYNSGNTFPSTYDPLGRRYTVGVRLKF